MRFGYNSPHCSNVFKFYECTSILISILTVNYSSIYYPLKTIANHWLARAELANLVCRIRAAFK